MALTIPAEDAVQIFLASGWRPFLLNRQFEIYPPYDSLANLCPRSDLKTGRPFVSLFTPSSQEELRLHLAMLAANPGQPISSLALTLKTEPVSTQKPVEIMLYPPSEKISDQAAYVGFIRLLSPPLIDFSAKNSTRQLNLSNSQFGAVARLGYHMAAILNLNELLDWVVTSLSRDFAYKQVAIFLVDTNRTEATLAASNVSTETIPSEYLKVKIDDHTVIGRVAITATPLRIENRADSPYNPVDYLPVGTQTELAVPLVTEEQVLGILDIRSQMANDYRQDDLLLLQMIANQLAVAIKNARLFEERNRRLAELDMFNQIGVMIVGDQDLKSMLSDILHRISTFFEVEAVSLMLLEEDGLHFALSKGAGADEVKSFVLKPGQGIAWSVVDTKQTIRVDEVASDPRHFSEIDTAIDDFTTRSLLAVPVQIQDRMLGVIEMMNRLDGQPFSQENEVTLEFIASAIAVSIENERLFKETEEQLKAVTTLTRGSEAITKAHSLDQLLNVVLELALSIIGAKTGGVVLPDNPFLAKKLCIEVARGFGREEIERFNRSNFSHYVGIFGESCRTGQILEVENSATDPRVFSSAKIEWQFPESFTLLPLFSQDNFVGLIILQALPPNDDTRSLLNTVADMAAVAIDKARLYQETNQWLAEVLTLYTLAEQLTKVSDLSLSDVTQSSVSILGYALDCSHCRLFLKEKGDDPESLGLNVCSSSSPEYERDLHTEYLARLAQAVIKKSRSVWIEDITQPGLAGTRSLPELATVLEETGAGQTEIQIRSVMIVPLIVKDEVIGALSIDHEQANTFGHSEERLLTIAAAQISTAIENIRLYGDLEQRAAELEVALGEVQEAHRTKSDFMQNVSHELRTPLTFIRAYVELMLEGSLGELPQEVEEKLEIVSQKTEAIARLVEDVILLQKIESGNLKFELIRPHELVARASYAATASAAEHNLEIVSRSAPALPPVKVDIDRIGQVFDNLVVNAIKFSPAGSKIIIAAELERDWIRFSVQDFGIGIPADQLNKIFERFYQINRATTRRFGGSGLGLAIVKQIIEAHGGQISIKSTINKTTTFSFLLPICQEEVDLEPV